MKKHELLDLLRHTGCADQGCPFRPPGGARTNGGCHCFADEAPDLRVPPSLRRRLANMAILIRELVRKLPEDA